MLTLGKTGKLEFRIETGTELKTRTSGSQGDHPQFNRTMYSTSKFFQKFLKIFDVGRSLFTCFFLLA